MTDQKLKTYRNRLLKLDARLRGDEATLEEEARAETGGASGGDLSNTPMHPADLGTAEYMQELDATLYENEDHLRTEVEAALGRIDAGTYGTCERCGRPIAAQRLDALPYVRHCIKCARAVESGVPTNLDAGRPAAAGLDPSDARRAQEAVPEGVIPGPDDQALAAEASDSTASARQGDRHAAGTPGGGTAAGGLAGTNRGTGDPANADLEGAMGSGEAEQKRARRGG